MKEVNGMDINFSKVNDYLYWGSSPVDGYWKRKKEIPDDVYQAQLSRDIDELRKGLGVKHILNVKHTSPPGPEFRRFKSVLWVPIPDAKQPTFAQADIAASFIRTCVQAEEPCFVHCRYGLGRSTTMVCAWLMMYEDMDFEKAEAKLLALRPAIARGWTNDQKDFLRNYFVRPPADEL